MWKWTQINHLKLIILDCESLNQKYIDFPYQHLLGVDVLKIESLDIDKNIDLDALIANFLIMAQCQSYEAIVISGDMTWLKKVMSYRIGTLFVGHLQQKDLKYMPDFVVDSIDSLVDVLSEKDKGYSGEVLTFENKKDHCCLVKLRLLVMMEKISYRVIFWRTLLSREASIFIR